MNYPQHRLWTLNLFTLYFKVNWYLGNVQISLNAKRQPSIKSTYPKAFKIVFTVSRIDLIVRFFWVFQEIPPLSGQYLAQLVQMYKWNKLLQEYYIQSSYCWRTRDASNDWNAHVPLNPSCVPSGEAANTNSLGLTRPGPEPTI